jgi:hypothetical protein
MMIRYTNNESLVTRHNGGYIDPAMVVLSPNKDWLVTPWWLGWQRMNHWSHDGIYTQWCLYWPSNDCIFTHKVLTSHPMVIRLTQQWLTVHLMVDSHNDASVDQEGVTGHMMVHRHTDGYIDLAMIVLSPNNDWLVTQWWLGWLNTDCIVT